MPRTACPPLPTNPNHWPRLVKLRLPSANSTLALQHGSAGVAGSGAKLLLDPDELVVLRHAVRAGERAGLDLPAIGGDREVGDGRVLGLAGAVRHHRRVVGIVRHGHGVERLRYGADLIDLDEDGVGDVLLDALFE